MQLESASKPAMSPSSGRQNTIHQMLLSVTLMQRQIRGLWGPWASTSRSPHTPSTCSPSSPVFLLGKWSRGVGLAPSTHPGLLPGSGGSPGAPNPLPGRSARQAEWVGAQRPSQLAGASPNWPWPLGTGSIGPVANPPLHSCNTALHCSLRLLHTVNLEDSNKDRSCPLESK